MKALRQFVPIMIRRIKAGTHEGACSRTRSRVSTPVSIHEGHDEGAE